MSQPRQTLQNIKEEKDEKGIIHKFFKPATNELLDKLLLHVVHGEQDEAEAIIQKNPQLLLDAGLVTDYSGRRIQGTALQVALGAGDLEMCKMIVPYLDKLDPTARLTQYQKQFPTDEKQVADTPEMQALRTITKVILDAKQDEITVSADQELSLRINERCQIELALFRSVFDSNEVITKGKHFDTALLFEALELANHHFKEFGGRRNSPKLILFMRQVLGYIQRYLPACYAQLVRRDITEYFTVDHEKLTRSLKFNARVDYSFSYFPLDVDPHYRLGYECFIDIHEARPGYVQVYKISDTIVNLFKLYLQKNQQNLQNLCNNQPLEGEYRNIASMVWNMR